jgi:hypothetical protein
MKTPSIFRFVLFCLVLAFPGMVRAKGLIGFKLVYELVGTDSLSWQNPVQQPDNKKPNKDKPEIKEVPRSRRLPKPTAVTERIKKNRPPVKVVRPRVIKRH